ENLNAHNSKFTWDKYKSIEELDEAFRQADLVQSEIKSKETELEELNEKLEKEQNNKERYQAGLDKISNDLTAGKTEIRTLQEQLKTIVPELYISVSLTEIE